MFFMDITAFRFWIFLGDFLIDWIILYIQVIPGILDAIQALLFSDVIIHTRLVSILLPHTLLPLNISGPNMPSAVNMQHGHAKLIPAISF